MADAGRVIAGSARGVRLAAPGPGTRPLTDRVKQTLFGILEPELADAAVLDLFAGSGAGGIEALSRGAASAVFVERDPGACRAIEENLRRAKVEDAGTVVRRDVVAWLADAARDVAAGTGPSFDLVLVDPPYADTASLVRVLEQVGPVVRVGGTVVSKHFWRDAPPARIGLLASERERRFGETALTFYRRTDPLEAGEA
jgi:16S rRNA (guanine(966)-N(2))-methyltransferase RsmD